MTTASAPNTFNANECRQWINWTINCHTRSNWCCLHVCETTIRLIWGHQILKLAMQTKSKAITPFWRWTFDCCLWSPPVYFYLGNFSNILISNASPAAFFPFLKKKIKEKAFHRAKQTLPACEYVVYALLVVVLNMVFIQSFSGWNFTCT